MADRNPESVSSIPSRKQIRQARRRARAEADEKRLHSQQTRRNLILGLSIAGGAAALVGGGAWIASHLDQRETSVVTSDPGPDGLYGANPEPHVDKELVRQLLKLEASYNQDGLPDSKVRTQHLQLSARAFALYSGTGASEEELVKSVHFLNSSAFKETFPQGKGLEAEAVSAYTDPVSGKVFIREDASAYSRQSTLGMRSRVPFFSPLSAARMDYEHEWMHRDGVIHENTKDQGLGLGVIDGRRVRLVATVGFGMIIEDPSTDQEASYRVLEEVFGHYMVAKMERQLTGREIFSLPSGTDQINRSIDRGIRRMNAIFQRKRDWVDVYAKFHKEADPIGFARFLADNSGYQFTDNIQKDRYAVELMMGIINDPDGRAFNDFFSRLR